MPSGSRPSDVPSPSDFSQREQGSESSEPVDAGSGSFARRSWHAMSEFLLPFSSSAVASLPKKPRRPVRYARADHIPDTHFDANGQTPLVRDYHAINSAPTSQVRVPKKIPTPIKVEGKVWFANERTWISYLNVALLISTFSLVLFNSSKDQIARNFAYTYAAISIGVMVYGYLLYQHRITKIQKRDPGAFDSIWGPILISAALFTAVLANFLIRVRELEHDMQDLPPPPPL